MTPREGTYDPKQSGAGRRAEQKAMNDEGGLDNLDNKRNEIRRDDWTKNGIRSPLKPTFGPLVMG